MRDEVLHFFHQELEAGLDTSLLSRAETQSAVDLLDPELIHAVLERGIQARLLRLVRRAILLTEEMKCRPETTPVVVSEIGDILESAAGIDIEGRGDIYAKLWLANKWPYIDKLSLPVQKFNAATLREFWHLAEMRLVKTEVDASLRTSDRPAGGPTDRNS